MIDIIAIRNEEDIKKCCKSNICPQERKCVSTVKKYYQNILNGEDSTQNATGPFYKK